MPYDLILALLAAGFPVIGCALFLMFWKLSRDDSSPDPIYQQRPASRH
jgi:hypothetical protein